MCSAQNAKVGTGLLADAVSQPEIEWLVYRIREQARSHIFDERVALFMS